MFNTLKKLVLYGIVLGTLGVVTWFWGFLGEYRPSTIADDARAKGLSVPLEDVWVKVSLNRMVLSLMSGETEVKRYDIGYGKPTVNRMGPERGTPVGEYRVLRLMREGFSHFERGSRFIVIDYPSEDDIDRAFGLNVIEDEHVERLMDARLRESPPPTDTPLGPWLGIQGNYFPFKHRRFTDGSVALSNADLNEVFEQLKPGSRVVIQTE